MELYKQKEAPISARVEDLLSRMTLDEKVGQINQRLYGWKSYQKVDDDYELTDYFKDEVARFGGIGCLYGVFRADPWSRVNHETGIPHADSLKVARMLQAYVREHTRLGIPLLLSEEVPHGHQALDSVLYPTNIGMGSTWNPELQMQVSAAVAAELHYKGVQLGLVSALDVLREPRWGRSEECFSEDPYLASIFTTAVVAGLQRKIDSTKTVAVLKHFCAQGEPMGGHNTAAAVIGERELREIFLLPMVAGIGAGAKATMAAYNEIDGMPCHANKWLLTDVLRDELGFDGFVMADGVALDRLRNDDVDGKQAAAFGLEAGVDLSLWDDAYTHAGESVTSGLLDEAVLDKAVTRILTLKFELGLFDEELEVVEFDKTGAEAVSLQAAREAIVLLQNNEQLPLSKDIKHIAVIGPNANHLYNQLGDYTSPQRDDYGVTMFQGIAAAVDGQVSYQPGCGVKSYIDGGIAAAAELAAKADQVVLVLGGSSTRNFNMQFDSNGAVIGSSRGADMNCGENMDVADLCLPQPQLDLLDAVVAVSKQPVVSVIIQGRPHALSEVSEVSGSVVCAWYPGPFGGQAVAEVLFGDVNPSGKLPASLPRSSAQLPVYYNYKDNGALVDYSDMSGSPLFVFGHGLSYAQFVYKDMRFVDGRVEVTVENVSAIAGFETVQLYVKANSRIVTRRVKELKDFRKLWFEAGEERVVRFEVDSDAYFGYWNERMQFEVADGRLQVLAGGSSATALAMKLEISDGKVMRID
ncbi:glycoside hydrolase family 3 N-terminal domain-containing protein [Culicoidibacter larvae]|uniref:Beta-glucosidase n=1 Tax=Culicoidibacter larvae TaxID=2579976 RepID=A0A5R8Q824_9FIRM|nr:glycoside hydrolase family 3 N-terminal domain-containing protein [Culicoidibacter larvae]TLG71740.1 beta-glucosidase [Culicoidibacter larvae]